MIFSIFLWAHRPLSSCIQTHKPPFAAVACCRGTAASSPHSTRRGQALPPDLRRTRPTLTKDYLPNRLPMQRLSVSPCFFAAPMGYPVAAGGHRRQKAKSARQRQPNSLPNFVPPSSTQKHTRSTLNQPKGKNYHPSAVGQLRLRPARHPTQWQCSNGCVHFQRYAVAALPGFPKCPAVRAESPAPAPAPLRAECRQRVQLPRDAGTAFARRASRCRKLPPLPP